MLIGCFESEDKYMSEEKAFELNDNMIPDEEMEQVTAGTNGDRSRLLRKKKEFEDESIYEN